jgi:hypothetical protein
MTDQHLIKIIKEEHEREGLDISEEELMVWHDAITDAASQIIDKAADEKARLEGMIEDAREQCGTYYDSEIGETRINGYGNEEFVDGLCVEIEQLDKKIAILEGGNND